MLTIFRRTQSVKVRSRDVLPQFAIAPIAVGLIATVLGVFVGVEKSKFGDGAFLTALTLSVSILLGGVVVLFRSWSTPKSDTPPENSDTTP